jgi:hypothetical protein
MKQKVVAQSAVRKSILLLPTLLVRKYGLQGCYLKRKVDNKSAIALIKNPALSGQSRHIEVKYHLVHGSVGRGLIDVEFIGTANPLGNVLTKLLGKVKFQELRERICLKNLK